MAILPTAPPPLPPPLPKKKKHSQFGGFLSLPSQRLQRLDSFSSLLPPSYTLRSANVFFPKISHVVTMFFFSFLFFFFFFDFCCCPPRRQCRYKLGITIEEPPPSTMGTKPAIEDGSSSTAAHELRVLRDAAIKDVRLTISDPLTNTCLVFLVLCCLVLCSSVVLSFLS